MGDPQTLNCEVCTKPAMGVFCSPLGAISHAYCDECSAHNREPWSTLVGCLLGIIPGQVGDWVKPIIEATCAFYGKTEAQLWEQVNEIDLKLQAEVWADAVEPTEDLKVLP